MNVKELEIPSQADDQSVNPLSPAVALNCISASDLARGKCATRIEVNPVASRPEWRAAFKNGAEMSDAPLRYLIDGFLLEECGAFINGLSGHGKTLIGLSIAKAFINQTPLFGNPEFSVPERLPVLYLVPECGERSFKHRMRKFGLVRNDDMFLCRTLSDGDTLALEDEAVLKAAEGRVVILDTAIRFTNSTDENGAAENRYLSDAIFRLLKHGARAVIGMHHSPKSFANAEYMSLENCVRGSGDIGAMLGIAYAVKLIDADKTLIQVECVKPRDIDPVPAPFQIQGRPYIDETGDFKMVGTSLRLGDAIREQKKQARQAKKEEREHEEYMSACELFEKGLNRDEIQGKLGIGNNKIAQYRERWNVEKGEQ